METDGRGEVQGAQLSRDQREGKIERWGGTGRGEDQRGGRDKEIQRDGERQEDRERERSKKRENYPNKSLT